MSTPTPPTAQTHLPTHVDASPAPLYRTGPAIVPVIVGVLGLVVAGLVLLQTASDLTLDWSRFGPAAIIVTGLTFVVLGLFGMRQRGRDRSAAQAATAGPATESPVTAEHTSTAATVRMSDPQTQIFGEPEPRD